MLREQSLHVVRRDAEGPAGNKMQGSVPNMQVHRRPVGEVPCTTSRWCASPCGACCPSKSETMQMQRGHEGSSGVKVRLTMQQRARSTSDLRAVAVSTCGCRTR